MESHSDRIHAFISEKFPLAKKLKLGPNDNLLESGAVDSLGMLDLVSYLQTEFGIEISDDELLPENFQSVQTITAFVQSKLN